MESSEEKRSAALAGRLTVLFTWSFITLYLHPEAVSVTEGTMLFVKWKLIQWTILVHGISAPKKITTSSSRPW